MKNERQLDPGMRALHKRELLASVEGERWAAAAFHLSVLLDDDPPAGVSLHVSHECICQKLHDGHRPQGIRPDSGCPFHGDKQHRAFEETA